MNIDGSWQKSYLKKSKFLNKSFYRAKTTKNKYIFVCEKPYACLWAHCHAHRRDGKIKIHMVVTRGRISMGTSRL